jgi:hypothetical protein
VEVSTDALQLFLSAIGRHKLLTAAHPHLSTPGRRSSNRRFRTAGGRRSSRALVRGPTAATSSFLTRVRAITYSRWELSKSGTL